MKTQEEDKIQRGEEELHVEGKRVHKSPWTEKHDVFEERKEFHLGQSMARMLRDRTGEGTMPWAL